MPAGDRGGRRARTLWDLVPGTGWRPVAALRSVRWDEANLYVLVEVVDGTSDAGDVIDLYVDDANAKANDYQAGTPATVGRTVRSAVTPPRWWSRPTPATGRRWRYLLTPGSEGREVGFDIRVTDEATGNRLSWSDQSGQDMTPRWGTLTLIEQVRRGCPVRDGAGRGRVGDLGHRAHGSYRVTVRPGVPRRTSGCSGTSNASTSSPRWLTTPGRRQLQPVGAGLDRDLRRPEHKSGAYGAKMVSTGSAENHRPSTVRWMSSGTPDQRASGRRQVRHRATVELIGMERSGSYIGLELQVNDGTDGRRTAVHVATRPDSPSGHQPVGCGAVRGGRGPA